MSDNTSPPVKDEELGSKIENLESDIVKIQKLNSKKNTVRVVGVLLILLILILFFYKMWNHYANNYDYEGLNEKGMEALVEIVNSAEMQTLRSQAMAKLLPQLQKELIKQFNAKRPEFEESALRFKEHVAEYVKTDLKEKLETELARILDNMQKKILADHSDITPEKLQHIIDIAKTEYHKQLTDMLNAKLDKAISELARLNKVLVRVENTEKYKSLRKDQIKEIEMKFVESLLELALYETNPKRGSVPAFTAKGGQK